MVAVVKWPKTSDEKQFGEYVDVINAAEAWGHPRFDCHGARLGRHGIHPSVLSAPLILWFAFGAFGGLPNSRRRFLPVLASRRCLYVNPRRLKSDPHRHAGWQWGGG